MYNLTVDISYDAGRNCKSIIAHRGLLFDLVRWLDWNSALIMEDGRHLLYTECRFQVFGKIDGRMCMMVFMVPGESLRIISLRDANSREIARYEETQS